MNHQIPEDLKLKCPNCDGEGKIERAPFTYTGPPVGVRCSACHAKGWIWALDQQEMAERIAQVEADREALQRENDKLTHTNALLQECQANHDWWVKRAGELEAENERLKAPWKLLPDEAAWWWHWTAEDLAIPFIYHVQKSGTAKGRFFIDFPDSRWCDEVGGFWLKVQYPNVPSREEQAAIIASRTQATNAPHDDRCGCGECNISRNGPLIAQATKGAREERECCE